MGNFMNYLHFTSKFYISVLVQFASMEKSTITLEYGAK